MSPEQSPVAEPVGIVDSVLAAGRCEGVGWFRFWFADQRWEWSDDVAAMYGYAPGEVEPTTELLLSHKHPDDREPVECSIAIAVEAGDPICGHHRIVDTGGAVREVMVVGDQLVDESGEVAGVFGYYLDVTETLEEERSEAVSDVLPDIIEARARIEQAKGALSLVYGISPEQAYRVLQWRSQETNTKVRDLAAQMIQEFRRVARDTPDLRGRTDHIVLTAHERVTRD
ncbi:PAS and ANTAR domain-containing protein [Nocardia sp. XZ_19_385]|uniref:PAS and ANTAR domain-containing protein n=1 Tax=Nocardia sp. XZ_19_385 TaxID=2769488 RepID=UPI00188F45C6|nr:PAS and ANTAR domain-containing protein [Nocardia sp. XZ_19_385]